ncbi:MAG: kelch repeat-containing protein [Kofleriaceae bacterium]
MRILALLLGLACGSSRPQPIANLATPRASHSASLLADGTVLVSGGFRKGPDGRSQLYSDTTEIFDPASNAIARGPAMVAARCGHVAVTLTDGAILIAGGWNEHGVMRSAELYDPRARTFSALPDLAEARGGATATALANGHALVIGGGTASIEELDPATRTWRPAGSLSTPRSGHTATVLRDGRVLVVGGEAGRGTVLASAEVFDPKTGRSVAVGSLATARYKHGAVRLANGNVLVIAGSSEQDWRGKYASTEIYDARTATFGPGPTLTEPRFKLPGAVVALPGGDVAIAGGAATIERVHDTATRTVGRLDAASYYGTATLLPTGELVVIGGYDDDIHTSSAIWRITL